MTHVGTWSGWAWVVAPVALLGLASCSSSVTTRADEKLQEAGSRHDGGAGGGGSGAGGASVDGGAAGSGGAPAGGGSSGTGGTPWECFGGGHYCTGGVVYEGFYGYSPDGKCSRPVDTCPYGCNADWHWRDAASPICNSPPPGCDDAGHCVDAGTPPGSEPTEAGVTDAARD